MKRKTSLVTFYIKWYLWREKIAKRKDLLWKQEFSLRTNFTVLARNAIHPSQRLLGHNKNTYHNIWQSARTLYACLTFCIGRSEFNSEFIAPFEDFQRTHTPAHSSVYIIFKIFHKNAERISSTYTNATSSYIKTYLSVPSSSYLESYQMN